MHLFKVTFCVETSDLSAFASFRALGSYSLGAYTTQLSMSYPDSSLTVSIEIVDQPIPGQVDPDSIRKIVEQPEVASQ